MNKIDKIYIGAIRFMINNRKCAKCQAALRPSQTGELCSPCQEKEEWKNFEQSSLSSTNIRKPFEGTHNFEQLYTVEEAAEILRHSDRTIRNMIYEGKLKFVHFGKRKYLIPREEIERLINPRILKKREPRPEGELVEALSRLEQSIEILKTSKTSQDIEAVSNLLRDIPFSDKTAKLYSLFLDQDSDLLTPNEKAEVLEGFRIIFQMNRNRDDPLSMHLSQRSAHWMARSGEAEFALTVKRLYRDEITPLLKRGMMIGLLFANLIEPEEFLSTFLNHDSNRLLNILIYQIRNNDVPYSINKLIDENVTIGSNFKNSLQMLLDELKISRMKPLSICSFHTLNDILSLGKERATEDFRMLLLQLFNRDILNSVLSKRSAGSLWNAESERFKQFIKNNIEIKNLLVKPEVIRRI